MPNKINKENGRKISECITYYDVCNRAEGKSLKTVDWYTANLNMFLRYLHDRHLPNSIDVIDTRLLREYVLYLQTRPKFLGHPFTPTQDDYLSVESIRDHVRTLKAFSSWLHAEHYTAENRLENLKLPKATATIIDILTLEEINKINACFGTNSFSGIRNRTMFETLLDTGLRASGVTGITLGNLNLADGFIKVMGKGAKERFVPVGKHVSMVIFSYIDRTRSKFASPDCDKLFISRSGGPITVNTVKLMFSRLARASGVTRLHAHLCRHTFATNYLLNGGDIFSLKEILGHTTFEMVNRYLHFTSSQITAQHHKYSPMDKFYKEL